MNIPIFNKTKNTILAKDAEFATSISKRLIGLLKYKELKKGQALVIRPCNSIHTFFMRFPIDVIFVNKQNQVVKTIPNLKPWRLTGIYLDAKSCIELPSGTVDSSLTSPGDLISFNE